MRIVRFSSRFNFQLIKVDRDNSPLLLTEPEHLSVLKNCLDPKNFLQKARSLMVVVSSPPTQIYEVFTKKVREYNSKKPFNFTTPELLKKFEKVFSDGGSRGPSG